MLILTILNLLAAVCCLTVAIEAEDASKWILFCFGTTINIYFFLINSGILNVH